MNHRAYRGIGAALILLSGCGSAEFTENDQGKTVEVDQGSEFTITLPPIRAGARQAPDIKGALVRLMDRRLDAAANEEIFRFAAEGAGDADIRIAPPDPSVPEFVIRVRVLRSTRAASPPGYSGKPPGSY